MAENSKKEMPKCKNCKHARASWPHTENFECRWQPVGIELPTAFKIPAFLIRGDEEHDCKQFSRKEQHE